MEWILELSVNSFLFLKVRKSEQVLISELKLELLPRRRGVTAEAQRLQCQQRRQEVRADALL